MNEIGEISQTTFDHNRKQKTFWLIIFGNAFIGQNFKMAFMGLVFEVDKPRMKAESRFMMDEL